MSNKFVDKDLINIAKAQDVFDILAKDGIAMNLKDGIYRHREHDSLVITPNKGYYWFSQGIGSSNPIDYYIQVENMSFVDAVYRVLNAMNYDYSNKDVVVTRAESRLNKDILPKEFKLPEKNIENKHVYAYLTKTRKIDKDLVQDLFNKGLLYQDKEHNNAVFIGKDYDGNIVSAFKRSTKTNLGENSWKSGDVFASQKEYRLRIENPNSKILNVFESEIDMLSYLSLQHKIARNENYIALGGISTKALMKFLDKRDIQHINICTDNDEKGHEFSKKAFDELADKYFITREIPKLKDFNEVLVKDIPYSRQRIEILSFEEETLNMSKAQKIRYIEEKFSKVYQKLFLNIDSALGNNKINISQDIKINNISKKNYLHKDSIENYCGYRNKLNIGVEKNLIDFLKDSKYEHSREELKHEQNKIHTNTKNWHYFNKTVLIDECIYKINIDVREANNKNTYLHKVRLIDITKEYIVKSNDTIIEIEHKKKRQIAQPNQCWLQNSRPPSNVNNNIRNEERSQENQKDIDVKKQFSFSKSKDEYEF